MCCLGCGWFDLWVETIGHQRCDNFGTPGCCGSSQSSLGRGDTNCFGVCAAASRRLKSLWQKGGHQQLVYRQDESNLNCHWRLKLQETSKASIHAGDSQVSCADSPRGQDGKWWIFWSVWFAIIAESQQQFIECIIDPRRRVDFNLGEGLRTTQQCAKSPPCCLGSVTVLCLV